MQLTPSTVNGIPTGTLVITVVTPCVCGVTVDRKDATKSGCATPFKHPEITPCSDVSCTALLNDTGVCNTAAVLDPPVISR
ncbi:MAG: hypothetical protein LC126_30195 [Bryobacterales bacterium]|nr:hypothetical protein [Bryobacterales bacterium]